MNPELSRSHEQSLCFLSDFPDLIHAVGQSSTLLYAPTIDLAVGEQRRLDLMDSSIPVARTLPASLAIGNQTRRPLQSLASHGNSTRWSHCPAELQIVTCRTGRNRTVDKHEFVAADRESVDGHQSDTAVVELLSSVASTAADGSLAAAA
jgi:hypothetical protein